VIERSAQFRRLAPILAHGRAPTYIASGGVWYIKVIATNTPYRKIPLAIYDEEGRERRRAAWNAAPEFL
jgi:hypothetical protein